MNESISRFGSVLSFLGRLLLAYMFVTSGWSKIMSYAATSQYMDTHGVPASLLPLVIAVELGGGLLIAFGILTRLTALVMAAFTIATAVFFHADFADPAQLISFNKNLTIAGGFLVLAAFGPGRWSVDDWHRMRVAARLGL
ncbi:MAG TPA: DoxX family protein [Pedomonas sp.]|uniref:DoxX family protein n=1 Tax=Pedomonas sp. TaxID=2976421 RepID=UPI002F3F1650